MKHLILVEDDKRLRELVSQYLTDNGFLVTALADGHNLVQIVSSQEPDVVVLDVMLPGEDGFSLCKQLRAHYQGPLLFMTAKDEAIEQVLGFELGADDYIVKPVEPRLLLARLNAVLRRSAQQVSGEHTDSQLTYGMLTLDRSARRVLLAGQEIGLTSHEFDLLWLLASHPSQVVDRDTIYRQLIGRDYDGLDRSADVRISRLRKKLNDDAKQPFRIKTIWGKGFFFVADAWD